MTEQQLPRHTIVIPNSVPVVAVLGARDEFVFCAPADEPDACIERALASTARPFFVSDSGIFWPCNSFSFGLGSNRSSCDGAPSR